MLALLTLTPAQKTQLRNAFTLIDGDSRDSKITKDDLVRLYQSLGLPTPSSRELDDMLGIGTGGEVTFNLFLSTIAAEIQKLGDVAALHEAIKVFADDSSNAVDVEKLKDACCSVQLGDKTRLERSCFDELVDGFVREQSDGKRVFMAAKWIDSYIE